MTADRRFGRYVLVLALVLVAGASAFAQETYTATHTYDMYHPKRARGYQPVPFDVGEIDEVNLANGNVTLSLPIGPALNAGGDLIWQVQLFYNSKVWSRDSRDVKYDHDPQGDPINCMKDEGKGYLVGEPHLRFVDPHWIPSIGLGWTLKLPHVYLRRVQHYEATSPTNTVCDGQPLCEKFYLDSVVTSDGARHQLRPCLDRWECTDTDPNLFYAADGSGWRVRWIDEAPLGEFNKDDHLIGEHGGLRYIFDYWVLLDDPGTGVESIDQLIDTDFQSEARGWYCTRIESIRWSDAAAGSAFPAIEIAYPAGANRRYAPTPERIQSFYADGISTGKIQLSLLGDTTDTITFFDENDAEYLRYNLVNSSRQTFAILDFPETQSDPDCHCCTYNPPDCWWGDSCEGNFLPLRHTAPFHFLDELELVDPDVPGTPELEWVFDYQRAELPAGDREMERKGALTEVILPNGTTISYEYGLWQFDYQKLVEGFRFICVDFHNLGNISCGEPGPYEQEFDFTRILVDDETVGVTVRKVVSHDNKLLEWSEYYRKGVDGPRLRARMLNRWGLPFDYSNHTHDRNSDPIDLLATDKLKYFFTGYNQTVARRHLIADDNPGGSADDTSLLTEIVELPESRFDDTIYIFSNGRAIHSLDNCVGWKGESACYTGQTHADHWGTTPLDGRLLEVRYYRGSAEWVTGDLTWFEDTGPNFTWFEATAPEPERIELYTYTLDPEDGTTLAEELPADSDYWTMDVKSPFCLNEDVPRWGIGGRNETDDLLAFCSARSENLRTRKVVVEDLYTNDDDESASFFSGSESWYETDNAIPGSPSTGTYAFQWNLVLTRSVTDFLALPPGDADWDLLSTTTYNESMVDSTKWITTLPDQRLATFAGDFARVSHGYDEGILETKTQHAATPGAHDDDVTTRYSYWDIDADANAGNYGRVRTMDLENKDALGAVRVDDSTGFEYDHQVVNRVWKLCAEPTTARGEGRGPVDRCVGWTTHPSSPFVGEVVELLAEQVVDATWRRPISVLDGNGDGVSLIDYDILGRIIELDPTDTDKAKTWIDYPDLRTTEIAVHDPDAAYDPVIGGNPNLVARYEFDGLGRIRHAARRREGTSPDAGFTEPDDPNFRHKTFFYDGVGTAWAESHWLKGTDIILTAPISFISYPDLELVARVDPFGRVEKTVASDGGWGLSASRGQAYTLTAVADNGTSLIPLSQTVSRQDARGNIVDVWEDKNVSLSVLDPLTFPTAAELGTRSRFINTSYAYDVADRMTSVTVDPLGVSQTRSFVYNAVGNLTSTTLPEIGDGNGTITYEDFDARGNPKSMIYPDENGVSGEGDIVDTYEDAAGRFIERWVKHGRNWYKVGSATYGASSAAHNVGKPLSETRYNLVVSAPEPCPDGCVKADSVGVTHNYVYGDAQGLLSYRTTTVSFGGEAATGGSQSFGIGYSYDLWSNVNEIEYPKLLGLTGCEVPPAIVLTWDAVGLVEAKEGTQDQDLLTDLYFDDATGMLTLWQTPADDDGGLVGMVQHSVAVDGTRPRPLSITATNEADTQTFFDSGTYVYDVLGNVKEMGTSWSYTYDDLGRLSTVTHDGSPYSYGYDDLGNMVSIRGTTFLVDTATNRLDTTAGYAYDQRGNLVSEPQPSPDDWTRHFQFDLENNLVAAWATGTDAPADQIGFAYDLAGERVLRYRVEDDAVDSATFSIRDEAGNVLTDFEWVSTGDWFRMADHLYMGRRPIVHLSSNPIGRTYTTVVTDHLQSTRAEVINADSTVQTSTDYWPFGETAQQDGIPVGKHLFTAHEREHTGTAADTLQALDYMHARYYSHGLGRFVSVDPVGGTVGSSQTWNRYSYVYSNPINWIDPFGLRARRWGSRRGLPLFVEDEPTMVTARDPRREAIEAAEAAAQREAFALGLAEMWERAKRGEVMIGGVASGVASLGTAVGRSARGAGSFTRIRRFFYDPRQYATIRAEYWAARGPANGRSLHHLFFAQRASRIPLGLRNAGFNLLEMPALQGLFHPRLTANTWMGFARNWPNPAPVYAAGAEYTLRVTVPVLAATEGAAVYHVTSEVIYEP